MTRFPAVAECTFAGGGRCPRTGCRYYERRAFGGCALAETEAHPGGMSLSRIGQLLGLSRQGVHLIERAAVAKLWAGIPNPLRSDLEAALRAAEAWAAEARLWPEAPGNTGLTQLLRARAVGGPRGLRDMPRGRRRCPQDASGR